MHIQRLTIHDSHANLCRSNQKQTHLRYVVRAATPAETFGEQVHGDSVPHLARARQWRSSAVTPRKEIASYRGKAEGVLERLGYIGC